MSLSVSTSRDTRARRALTQLPLQDVRWCLVCIMKAREQLLPAAPNANSFVNNHGSSSSRAHKRRREHIICKICCDNGLLICPSDIQQCSHVEGVTFPVHSCCTKSTAIDSSLEYDIDQYVPCKEISGFCYSCIKLLCSESKHHSGMRSWYCGRWSTDIGKHFAHQAVPGTTLLLQLLICYCS